IFTLRSSMLGLFATALSVGCASNAEPTDEGGETGSATGAITAMGAPIISGCNVSQVFDIQSPLNQNIDFVAIQSQNLNDLETQLFAVDQSGTQTALQNSAHAIDSSLQQVITLFESTSSSQVASNSASGSNSSSASGSASSSENANSNTNVDQSSNV